MTETELDAWVSWMVEQPTWEEFWCVIEGEEWLAAKALIELSDVLLADASRWLRYRDEGRRRTAELDLRGWVADVDETGRAGDWSSTQWHAFELAASMIDRERKISLQQVLGYSGSWERPLWSILVDWGSGGNVRDTNGRLAVIPNN